MHLIHEDRYLVASMIHPKFKMLESIEEEKRKRAFKLFRPAVEIEMSPTEDQAAEKPKDKIASSFATKRGIVITGCFSSNQKILHTNEHDITF